MGPWNKPEHRSLARGFMPRKPVDRRRAERDSSGHPSGNIDLIQRKDWSIWADKMISSRGIYSGEKNAHNFPCEEITESGEDSTQAKSKNQGKIH